MSYNNIVPGWMVDELIALEAPVSAAWRCSEKDCPCQEAESEAAFWGDTDPADQG